MLGDGVLAGTGRVLDAIEDFRFDEEELAFLSRERIVDAATIDWLREVDLLPAPSSAERAR